MLLLKTNQSVSVPNNSRRDFHDCLVGKVPHMRALGNLMKS